MASLNMAFGMVAVKGRKSIFVTQATKGGKSNKEKEKKGLLEFILGALIKEEQLFETDPILNQTQDNKNKKSSTSSISVPIKKKSGGFGVLFSKD